MRASISAALVGSALALFTAGASPVGAAQFASEARIVFESDRGHSGADGTDMNLRDIWIMDADGRNAYALTSNRFEESGPRCSPDGSRIAFTRRQRGNADVYVMPMPGGRAKAITRNSSYETAPAWSPDGRLIAYTRLGEKDSGDIWIGRPDGSKHRMLVGGRTDDRWPQWSPSGKQIAFIRANPATTYSHFMFVVSTEGGRPIKLFSNVYDDDFAWSPDGSMIALTRPSRIDPSVSTVWIVNVRTGRQRQLPGKEIGGSAWSPDGTMLAVTTFNGIGVIPVDGSSRVHELIPPSLQGTWNWSPSWCR